MKWAEILKKTFEYVKKYRALWCLGILAALTEGGMGSGYSIGNNWQEGDKEFEKFSTDAVNWIGSHGLEIGIIIFAGFIISLLILYISYSARAGLIFSINEHEEGKDKVSFADGFHAGQKYFWRFLGLTLLICLTIFIVVMILLVLITGLIALAIATSLWLLTVIIPLALITICGIIVFALYMNLTMTLAYREIVIKNKGIVESIDHARHLLHHNFGNVIIAWLIQTAAGVVFGIASAIAILVIGGLLLAIGVGLYFAIGLIGAVVYGSVVGLAFLAFLLTIGGVFNAFISTFWTLFYKEVIKQ